MIHWISTPLSPSDRDKIEPMLAPQLSGGFQAMGTYDLVDDEGHVIDSVSSPSLNDAGKHFLMKTNPVQDPVALPCIPPDMRIMVLRSINMNAMCTCDGTCVNPECDQRTIDHARRYIKAYMKHAAQPPPAPVRIRHDGTIHTFTPTRVPVAPSIDAVRDGVVARLHVAID